MPSPIAGRVFLGLTVLLFALGFRALCRSLQGHKTAVEWMGFVFAYGYFAHAGYLGYLFTLGLAFFILARAHRRLTSAIPWSGRDTRFLALAATVAWWGHLVSWVVLAGVLVVWAGAELKAGRRARARALALALVPSLLCTAYYTVHAWHGLVGPGAKTKIYSAPDEKKLSLIGAVTLFVRPDPMPPIAPPLWTNLVALSLVAATAIGSVIGKRDPGASPDRRRPGPTRAAAALLAGIALLWPWGSLGGMGRPDERLAMPALLLGLAALPVRRTGRALEATALLTVFSVLGLHTAEFRTTSRRIDGVLQTIRAEVPADAQYLAMTLWEGRLHGSCEASAWPSLGQPVLKWIALERSIETGMLRSHPMGSGLILDRIDTWEHVVVFINAAARVPVEVRAYGTSGGDPQISHIVMFGCGDDRESIARYFAPYYTVLARGEYLTVLRHR